MQGATRAQRGKGFPNLAQGALGVAGFISSNMSGQAPGKSAACSAWGEGAGICMSLQSRKDGL